MQHIKEVSELVLKIKKALQVMNFNKEEYAESEVVFRLTSIRGMLIMALNDSSEMLKKWKDEEQITSAIHSDGKRLCEDCGQEESLCRCRIPQDLEQHFFRR